MATSTKRFVSVFHYPKKVAKHSKESSMPVETTAAAHDAITDKRVFEKRSPIGNWEIHSWGDGKFSGMAAISAITTLQIGATLTPIPADRVALNKAAEYLLNTLASQLKSFQQALTAD
jgi:hypothetical protein